LGKRHVKADVVAREVICVEKSTEKLLAGQSSTVEHWAGHWRSVTDRLAIEDGALLRGKVEAGRPANQGSRG